jgi:hypothetical protein
MTNQLALRDEYDIEKLAGHFVKSGYFQDASDVSKAVVKIQAGREFGFGAFASMTNIYIIQGRPSIGANLMAAAVKNNPRYDYRVRQMDDDACKIEYFQRNGDKWESLGVSTFTLADARKAGTKNLDKFPRNMLFARAMSNGVRWYCPDVFGTAIYTPEEMGAEVTEDGDVIQGTFVEATVKEEKPALTLEAALEMTTAKGNRLGDLTDEQLQYLIEHTTNGLHAAARMVLDSRIAKRIVDAEDVAAGIDPRDGMPFGDK